MIPAIDDVDAIESDMESVSSGSHAGDQEWNKKSAPTSKRRRTAPEELDELDEEGDEAELYAEERHIRFGDDSAVPVAIFQSDQEENSLSSDGESETGGHEGKDDWAKSLKFESAAIPLDEIEKAKTEIENRNAYWTDIPTSHDSLIHPYVLLISILQMLHTGETPRRAMDRFLGKPTPVTPASKAFKSTIKSKRTSASTQGASMVPAVKDTQAFDKITELTDAFTAKQGQDLLDETRERIYGRLNRIPFEYRIICQQEKRGGPVTYDHLDQMAKQLVHGNSLVFRQMKTDHEWIQFLVSIN